MNCARILIEKYFKYSPCSSKMEIERFFWNVEPFNLFKCTYNTMQGQILHTITVDRHLSLNHTNHTTTTSSHVFSTRGSCCALGLINIGHTLVLIGAPQVALLFHNKQITLIDIVTLLLQSIQNTRLDYTVKSNITSQKFDRINVIALRLNICQLLLIFVVVWNTQHALYMLYNLHNTWIWRTLSQPFQIFTI